MTGRLDTISGEDEMDLLRTECSMITNSHAETMHLVRFVGEGGELIEIRFGGRPRQRAVRDDDVVAKAAATMMEVASFLAERERTSERSRRRREAGKVLAALLIHAH